MRSAATRTPRGRRASTSARSRCSPTPPAARWRDWPASCSRPRITTGQPNAGVGYELDAIAAVVIGGTSLSGGVGGVGGTILGALLMGVINNGLDLLNVSSYYQQIVKGVIIVGAVWLDRSQEQIMKTTTQKLLACMLFAHPRCAAAIGTTRPREAANRSSSASRC